MASGADIRYGGSRAFYHRGDDYIQVPNPGDFVGSPTSTPLECFHSVQLHELSHWAGAERRLNREKGKRFADRAYAFEEMVAQLSAAFLCAELGVSNDSRPDDAQYIAGFLDVLHNDKKAIFAAAAAASAAADYILSFSNRGQAARVA